MSFRTHKLRCPTPCPLQNYFVSLTGPGPAEMSWAELGPAEPVLADALPAVASTAAIDNM